MAEKEGARKTSEAYVVSTTPDVCLTPMGSKKVPVPYSIVASFFDAIKTVVSVLFKGLQSFFMGSRISRVEGDEAGTEGGVESSVNRGAVRPIRGSSTVHAAGQPVIRHDDPMEMNCAGPEGKGNTKGKVVYLNVTQKASITADGKVKGAAANKSKAKDAAADKASAADKAKQTASDASKAKGAAPSKTGLTDADYERAAKKLGVDKNAVKAVAAVESSGDGFGANGLPKTKFERHYFRRLTNGKYDKSHPTLSAATAATLDHDAAMKSTSWGKFQQMGEYYQEAGFDTLAEFLTAMRRSEADHLDAFANNILSNKTRLNSLRSHDWKAFAESYNGPEQKGYDSKMKKAYEALEAADKKAKKGTDGVTIVK